TVRTPRGAGPRGGPARRPWAEAPAWAWRSSPRSPRRTVGRCSWTPSPAGERPSGCVCRWQTVSSSPWIGSSSLGRRGVMTVSEREEQVPGGGAGASAGREQEGGPGVGPAPGSAPGVGGGPGPEGESTPVGGPVPAGGPADGNASGPEGPAVAGGGPEPGGFGPGAPAVGFLPSSGTYRSAGVQTTRTGRIVLATVVVMLLMATSAVVGGIVGAFTMLQFRSTPTEVTRVVDAPQLNYTSLASIASQVGPSVVAIRLP